MSDEPVKPGYIKLVQLKTEGKLQKGDKVETQHLGVCEVTCIQSADSIVVKNAAGKYFNLSGFGFSAKLVNHD